MKKKTMLISTAALLMLAGGLYIYFHKKTGRVVPTSLLVITLDTMRADRIGFFGDAKAKTPNLDFLARAGVAFLNCYTSVPLTLPSHCSIFTGQLPIAHGVRNNGFYYLDKGAFTMARLLKEQRGMETAAAVSAYVLLAKFGLNNGFDTYDDSLRSDEMTSDFESEIPADQVYEKYLYLFGDKRKKEFFYWLHFYDPHKPYLPPPEYGKMFPGDPYRGEIAFMDSCIGKILEHLRDNNLLDSTLIVVAGDHGEAFGEHQEKGHGVFCYQETLKVPLIFFNPKFFAEKKAIATPVELIDVLPTVCDIFGLTGAASMQGTSLLPLIADRKEKKRREIYFESMYGKEENDWAPLAGILTDSHKFISLPEAELYDLGADPREQSNLIRQKNRLAREMDLRLAKLVRTHAIAGASKKVALGADDLRNLQALGYVSSFSAKSTGEKLIDPKHGIEEMNVLEDLRERTWKDGEREAVKRKIESMLEKDGARIPILYSLLIKIYRAEKDLPNLITHLKRAVGLFKGTWAEDHFRINLAVTYLRASRLSDSLVLVEEVLRHNPKNANAFNLRGQIAELQNDLPAAIAYYEKAEAIEANNVAIKKKLAELHLKLNQFPETLAIYQKLLEFRNSRRNPDLLFNLAILNLRMGNPPEAERWIREAIDAQPNGKYYFNYALILSKNGKAEEALTQLNTALEKYRSDLSAAEIRSAERLLDIAAKAARDSGS